jgi:fibronectin type III domain protein
VGGDLRNILKAAAAAAVLGLALWAQAACAASVTLHWTAPGDDSLTGRATTYDLRYSLNPISALNFASATRWSTNQPLMAGSKETYTVTGLLPGILYRFALKTSDEAGNWSIISNVAMVSTAVTVGVSDPAGVALQFSSPRPNPARGTTAFTLGLPQAENVHVAAYDVLGRKVKTLLSGERPAGLLHLVWKLDSDEGGAVPAGVYLVRARVGDDSFERRVAVVR